MNCCPFSSTLVAVSMEQIDPLRLTSLTNDAKKDIFMTTSSEHC